MAGDHYIQAALMGRWGEPPAKAPRERNIAVRMKQPTKTFQTTPENVGKENNLYPAWLEKFWQVYEGDLIRVADALDGGALQPGDLGRREHFEETFLAISGLVSDRAAAR